LPVLRFFVDTGKNEAQNRRRSFTFFRSLGPSLGCFVTGRRAHLCFARSTNMKMTSKWILVSAVVSLAAFLCMTVGLPVVQGSADHVRWDIINFNAATTPPTVSAGGFAIAAARNPSTLTIKLTGSGTFIGPASGGTSSSGTGGGTWQTFSGNTSTGSGTYEVRELSSWQFANFATPGSVIDEVGGGTRANGNAVLRIT